MDSAFKKRLEFRTKKVKIHDDAPPKLIAFGFSLECFIQMHSDPWKLKYFDFSDFISSSRAEFIGRQWLYREMESELHHNNKLGVLITGNPGSGKSAFLSNLLCSNTSSPIIHNRILGYHFCMHFNKWTRSGANFVGNLANITVAHKGHYIKKVNRTLNTAPYTNKKGCCK